jgi:hypothetical protein
MERSIEDLKICAARCTTHHASCDCRELAYREKIEQLKEENEQLKAKYEREER